MARTAVDPARGARLRRILTAGLLAVVLPALAACTASAAPTPSARTPPHKDARLSPPRVTTVLDYVDRKLASMSLEQKIASLLMVHIPGTDATAIAKTASEDGVGGLILMGDNIPGSPEQLRAETATVAGDPALPRLLATDEEGGIVQRLPWDAAASARRLRSEPPEATQAAFTQRSELLESAGITVNFGIIADQTGDPASFIYDRVLGTDPSASAARVAAAVTGERGHVLSTLKHFPGHGEVEADSHTSVPATSVSFHTWKATDAVPFEAGIRAGAEFVMYGHLRYLAVDTAPASLSARWHRILTDDLGFSGVSITDDMIMLQHSGDPAYSDPVTNAVAALKAGNTMLLYVLAGSPAVSGVDLATLVPGIAAAVTAGTLPKATIDAAARKLLIVRRMLAHGHGPYTLCGTGCAQRFR